MYTSQPTGTMHNARARGMHMQYSLLPESEELPGSSMPGYYTERLIVRGINSVNKSESEHRKAIFYMSNSGIRESLMICIIVLPDLQY